MLPVSRCRILVFHFVIQNTQIEIHKNTILPVVLYGCENWSFKMREERRLSLFENTVLRRIFGPTRKEVTGERKKLHNEKPKLSVLLPNTVRVNEPCMRWMRHVEFMGEWRGVYRIWW